MRIGSLLKSWHISFNIERSSLSLESLIWLITYVIKGPNGLYSMSSLAVLMGTVF